MSFPLHQARWLPVVLSFGFTAASSVACAAEVTIVRDTWGVPHIFGQTEEAVAYGLGVAQCEDNLAIVVRNLYAGVGRLAELFGPQYLDGDIEARTLGHVHFARRDWPNLDPRVRLLVEAYCAGVNDYLEAHPHELPVPVAPVEPVQVIGWHRAVMLLSGVAIARNDAEASESDGYHPVYSPERSAAEHPGVPPGKSNSWALSGEKTAAGVPMLLIDPHWPPEGHLQLYEAYLHGGDLQVGGFMLHGMPLVAIGLSPAAAWTVTAGGADSSDAYALKINPEHPHEYEFDGRWEKMIVRAEKIRVREDDGLREETIDVLATRHGPILKTKAGVPFAAAFSGYERADTLEQCYRMATARNTQEFKAAIAMDRFSYFNLMWATAEGDIGYVQTGEVPVRTAGFNWNKLVPGWTSRTLYRGKVPFEKLPIVENPPSGFLQNCNVAANAVTPGLTFTREDFPIGALYGHYGQYRARGQRATQLLAEVKKATLEDARRIAFDCYVPPADLWVPVILQAYEERPKSGQEGQEEESAEDKALVAEAAALLREWDRFATKESVGATVFRFWRFACHEMDSLVGRDRFQVPNTPEVRRDAYRALSEAAKQLKATYGRLDVPWGQVKRLRRGDHQWPLSGDGLGALGMDTLRATAAAKLDGDDRLISRGGQSVTSVVLLTNPPRIRSVVAYGQSNKPNSKHYADQAPLYSAEQFRPVPWSPEQLAHQTESKRTLHYNH